MRTVAILHQRERSGPSRSLLPSLELLARAGSVEVIVPQAKDRSDSCEPASVAADYADFAAIRALPYEPMIMPRSPIAAGGLLLRLARELHVFRGYLREPRPDLAVIATGVIPAPAAAARLERIPTVLRVSEILAREHGGGLRTAGGRALVSILPRLADAIVCSSRAVAAQFHDGPRPAVETIYPGIDPAHGAGDGKSFRHRHAVPGASPLIAVVGNITRGRGQDLVIRALPEIRARLPEAHVLFAGAPHPRLVDAEYARGLRELGRSLGVVDHLTFTGFVERVADVYAAADVLVNPVRVEEAFGRVALEALTARCPVVAARIGAIPEVLRDGRDALLVAPDDPGEIARAVSRLGEDRELARRIGEDGRTRVLRDFGLERAADDFARVVAGVLDGFPAGERALHVTLS